MRVRDVIVDQVSNVSVSNVLVIGVERIGFVDCIGVQVSVIGSRIVGLNAFVWWARLHVCLYEVAKMISSPIDYSVGMVGSIA